MFKSNFKEINLRKLCDEAVLMKCILTFDNWNTRWLNATDTVIRTLDQSNSSTYRNSLAISTIIVFMYGNDHVFLFRV